MVECVTVKRDKEDIVIIFTDGESVDHEVHREPIADFQHVWTCCDVVEQGE